jgi:DNA-binding NtrC family response regulator
MEGAQISVIRQHAGLCQQAAVNSDERIIARSAAMHETLDRARQLAGTAIPVLLQGEIGVGKTTIAREIHRRSRFAAGPFVRVACGSLREAELEKKLFGAPEDSLRAEAGQPAGLLGLESGQRGTLFLDGIAQLPAWAQVKLLDCLQDGRDRSRAGGASVPSPVRVIASTTGDLRTAVIQSRFDARLYHYLDFFRIEISPLRHRPEDVRALAEHFLATASCEVRPTQPAPRRRFSEEAWECLLKFDWPGNVLQLATVVAHAAMLSEGPEIGPACLANLLGPVCRHPDSEMISVPLASSLKQMELAIINEVIRRCRGNKAAAARILGLHRRTLYRLLEE